MFSFNFSWDHIFQQELNLQIVKFKLFMISEKCHSDSKSPLDLKSFNGPCCYHSIFITLFSSLLYVCNYSEQNGFFSLFIFNKARKQKILANINLLYFKEEIEKKNRSKIFKMKTIKTWTILTISYYANLKEYHQKLPCFLWSWEKSLWYQKLFRLELIHCIVYVFSTVLWPVNSPAFFRCTICKNWMLFFSFFF